MSRSMFRERGLACGSRIVGLRRALRQIRRKIPAFAMIIDMTEFGTLDIGQTA